MKTGAGALPRLTIERRIGLGFAAILAIVATIAGIVISSVSDIRSLTASAEHAEALKSAVLATEVHISEDRNRLNRFLRTGDSQDMASLRSGTHKSAALIDQLGRLADDEATREPIEALKQQLRQFNAAADKLAKFDADRQSAVKVVLDTGAAITDPLVKVQGEMFERADLAGTRVVSRAVQASMGMRDAAGRFLALGTPEDRDRALKEADELDFRVSEMAYAAAFREPATREALSAVATRIETYAGAIKQIVGIAPERAEIADKQLPALGDAMGGRIGALTALSGERFAGAQRGAETTVQRTWTLVVTSAAIAMAVGIAMAWAIGRGISRPVRDLTHSMEALAGGHLETSIPARGRADELGQMAAAVQVFKDNAIRVAALEEEAKRAEELAHAARERAVAELADRFEAKVLGAVRKVAAESGNLKAGATTMAHAAETARVKAGIVEAASNDAANNVHTVADAANELTQSIREISTLVQRSREIGDRAVAQSAETNSSISTLTSAAERIGTVLRLIDEIASRTNLLALNATIEAARAGDAGRGFAIVATEVKSLAVQTANATGEIAQQIDAIQSATKGSAAAIGAIGETIATMSDIANTISAAVEHQGASTDAIAANIRQVASSTADVSANIAGVTQTSGEAGAAAQSMLVGAELLADQAEFLRHEVDTFLVSVRTG